MKATAQPVKKKDPFQLRKKDEVSTYDGVHSGVKIGQIRLPELLFRVSMLLLSILCSQSVPDAELHNSLTARVHELAVRIGIRVTTVFCGINATEIQLWADNFPLARFMTTEQLRLIIPCWAVIMAVTTVPMVNILRYSVLNLIFLNNI